MTIYDIAREAGVAASTVSRVINNKPGIRKETRERVKQLLEKYDYTPDAAARGLVMQSTKMIGILIVDIRVTHHVNSAFVIERELAKKGYCCITMGTGPTDEMKEEYMRILQHRRVEGVILMGSMYMTEKIKKNIQKHLSNVPVVMVNGYLDLPNVSGVLVDEDTGIYKCVNYLWGKGKEKIAFVLDAISPSNGKKVQGYRDGMMDNGCREEEILIYKCKESSLKGGYNATLEVLKEHPDTQGIIYSVDLVAVGGIRAAFDLGYDVPGKLGIIGVDNSIYGEICMPKLTTLNNKLEELSEAAASILYARLLGEKHSKKVMLYSEIIEREST